MGMTLDESIEVLKEHLRILNVDKGIEFWQEVEALEVSLDTMRKYQKIADIIDNRYGKPVFKTLDEIIKVVEDGNDNR